ncbi:MAG: hypothetical protein ACI4CT_08485 [Lachnospiraceae bacterium]
MAVSSFDTFFFIDNPEAVRKLCEILDSDDPGMPLPRPFSQEDRERSEKLFERWLSRYKQLLKEQEETRTC